MDKEKHKGSKRNSSFKTKNPSRDGRENPFVPGFGTKDLEGQQETAPNKKRDYFSLKKQSRLS